MLSIIFYTELKIFFFIIWCNYYTLLPLWCIRKRPHGRFDGLHQIMSNVCHIRHNVCIKFWSANDTTRSWSLTHGTVFSTSHSLDSNKTVVLARTNIYIIQSIEWIQFIDQNLLNEMKKMQFIGLICVIQHM